MTVKVPLVLSPSLGAGLPAASVPLAGAGHESFEVRELYVEVKSAEAPGAKLATLAGVKLAHEPPPATLISVLSLHAALPIFTTTVIVVFGATVVPGETLLVVRVVAGWMTVKVPLVLSPSVGAGLPAAS